MIADNRNFINWVYANNWQGRPYANMDQAMEMGGGQGLQQMINWRAQWLENATPNQLQAYQMGVARMAAYNEAQNAIIESTRNGHNAFARQNGYQSYDQYDKAHQMNLERVKWGEDIFVDPDNGRRYRIDKEGNVKRIWF